MEIRILKDESLLISQKLINIQLNSKNPIKFNENWFEIMCAYKKQQHWVKVDYVNMEKITAIKWKIDKHTDSYYCVTASVDNTTVIMSRYILNPKKGMFVDHINGNPLDNRTDNLRVCTHSQNMQNRKSLINRKWKGIYYCKIRENWVAQISINGKTKNIGRFMSAKQAAIAYNEQAIKHYGEFARINHV